MNSTRILRQAAEQRAPLIKFLGKRSPPSKLRCCARVLPFTNLPAESTDSTPHAHPASPSTTLPDSFVQYRSKAQQHGPLAHRSRSLSSSSSPSPLAYGVIGGHTGESLGSVKAPQGQYFDRSELPARFGRTKWTQAEIDAVETGGASLFA